MFVVNRKTHFLVIFGLLAFLALGHRSVAEENITIKQVRDAQLKAKVEELNKKASQAQSTPGQVAPGASQLPVNLPRQEKKPKKEEIRLVAVYGINDDLFADVAYRDAVFSVKPGDHVSGWRVSKVYTTRIIFIKGRETREYTLSSKPIRNVPQSPSSSMYGAPPPGTF